MTRTATMNATTATLIDALGLKGREFSRYYNIAQAGDPMVIEAGEVLHRLGTAGLTWDAKMSALRGFCAFPGVVLHEQDGRGSAVKALCYGRRVGADVVVMLAYS